MSVKVFFWFLILNVFIFSGNYLNAQNNAENPDTPSMEEIIEEQTEKLTDKLGLDDLQKAFLKANLKEYNSKALRLINTIAQREELKEAIISLRKKQKEDLSVFLTEEQINSFEKFQEKERKKKSYVRRSARRN
jgi:hypothetical protein